MPTPKPLKCQVKCDNCDWKKDNVKPKDWYNKQCPKCKNCIIINDGDLKIIGQVQELIKIGIVKSCDEKTEAFVKIKIDTAHLRKEQ